MTKELKRLKREISMADQVVAWQEEFFANNAMNEQSVRRLGMMLKEMEVVLPNARVALAEIRHHVEEAELAAWTQEVKTIAIRHYNLRLDLEEAIELKKPRVEECNTSIATNKFKGPKLNLPEFDGSTEKWRKFRDLFLAMVHTSKSLTDIEKFQYLEASIKLPAGQANVLSNFSLCGEDYAAAWQAVNDRYEDKKRILAHHMNALFAMKSMNNSSAEELRRIIDAFSSNLSSLKQLGFPLEENAQDLANLMLVHMLKHRLDETVKSEWRRKSDHESATFAEVMKFLVTQWKKLCEDGQPKKGFKAIESKPAKPVGRALVAGQSNGKKAELKCFLCQGAHGLWACGQFVSMSVDERRKYARENGLCYKCLSKSHSADKCRSTYNCKTCRKAHHTLLHFDSTGEARGSTSVTSLSPSAKPFEAINMTRTVSVPYCEPTTSQTFTARTYSTRKRCLFFTAVVLMRDVEGNYHELKALLDSASDTNFISTYWATKLGLKLLPAHLVIESVNNKITIVEHAIEADISSRYSEYNESCRLAVLDVITGKLPPCDIDVSKLNIPSDCFLADPNFYQSSECDLLLCNNILCDVLMEGRRKLPSGPSLLHTKFGWIVGGGLGVRNEDGSYLSCFTLKCRTEEESIDEKLEKFFECENVECPKALLSAEEKYCEQLFVETTKRGKDGRFVVRMPMKSNENKLGNNLSNAMGQLWAQEKRRKRDAVYDKLYVEYMEDFIATGHMSVVEPTSGDLVHYLPHHGVVKMTSTTTKLRPVCNASSRSESGLSLNDVMCIGPTVQSESFDILLRFREKRIVFTCDITKMYRQIWIHPSQRNLLRIVWRTNMDDEIRHYQFNTVTFGTSSAPFLATRVLVELAKQFESQFPEACQAIVSSFYMDDGLITIDTVEEGKQLLSHIRYMFSSIGMLLCKFKSNSRELLEGLPENLLDIAKEDETSVSKTLGVGFNSETDQFFYKMKPVKLDACTKADVLSELASIYDPIGWIGPVVLRAKVFMKTLWVLKLDWKDFLPEEVQAEWNEFRKELPAVNDIRIDRHCVIGNAVRVELHGFADASIIGYGAVLYALSYDQVGNIQTSIIAAKSRVAPKNQKTLARLELCAAALLAKFIDRVAKIFVTKLDGIVLWSDSTIVLHWISMLPARLSTYVGNRVAVILEMTHKYVWRHIKGTDNPADIISRGLTASEIVNCELWWNGPSFFRLPQTEWPTTIMEVSEDDPEIKEEVKKTYLTMVPDSLFSLIETRFSRLESVIKTFAFIKRFINNKCRLAAARTGPLSIEEREDAEMVIVRILQRNLFSVEVETLKKVQELRRLNLLDARQQESLKRKLRKSPLLQLAPFLDEKNILRVGGRIDRSPRLTYDQKHQILLPKCRFALKIVRFLHEKYMHVGKQSLCSIVKDKYWIMRGKDVANKVIRNCLRCLRINPVEIQQFMGDLPEARVTMKPPFTSSAVDYTGYYTIKASATPRNTQTTKVYVAVFKCMGTGAIHLELVTDLSTESFLAAFERFISRRGLCKELFSDNATCFEGADNELREIVLKMEREVEDFAVEHAVRWVFTTPRAPHAGGIYESAVKSMKHHLKRSLGLTLYSLDQFWTILCKVEAILNSRPLIPLSEDPTDFRVLTPGHFLVGRPLVAMPQRNYSEAPMSRLTKWKGLQKIQREFWNEWYHEYLHLLQTRPRGFREVTEIQVDDLVLIKDYNLPPMRWLIGRVVRLLPDKAGVVRQVELRTKNGLKVRHIKYLSILPKEEPEEDLAAGEDVRADDELSLE